MFSFGEVNLDSKKKLLKFLKQLGRFPQNTYQDPQEEFFLSLLNHNDEQIRFWAVKNLGKLQNPKYLFLLKDILQRENSSLVRREVVSSIGRIGRNKTQKTVPELIQVLKEILKDRDPNVVLQAVRGLLLFKKDISVQKALQSLSAHKNEIIREVIQKEIATLRNTIPCSNPNQVPETFKNCLLKGDVEEILQKVPEESVHLTFTSPPYYNNAKDYSLYQSYEDYLNFLERVFIGLHKITKEGRFFVLNTSPVIVSRFSRKYSSRRYAIPFDLHARLSKIGWEFIDDILWLKPEASVKNRNGGFYQHRKPLAYKPNNRTEYLMVYRKKTEKLIDWNIKQYDSETLQESLVLGDYESSNVWQIDPVFDSVHPAVFPLELCERVIKLYSYRGDLVFDPFAGVGTLGVASKKLNRYFFLTEKVDLYFQEMQKNLNLDFLPYQKSPQISEPAFNFKKTIKRLF